MDLREIVRESVDWIHLAQDRDQEAGSGEYSNEWIWSHSRRWCFKSRSSEFWRRVVFY